MKIVTVVGARPQFIKASVLSAELSRRGWVEILVHTGQHYDYNMSKIFFDGLDLKEPDHYLEVGSGSHGIQTATIIARLEPIIVQEDPDWVLVYGDTNTTLAGALVAAKLRVQLAHVEAGLRSYNRDMPEEINRVVTDHVADAHFAPTSTAVAQLSSEGISTGVHLVGDLMVDLVTRVASTLAPVPAVLQRFELRPGEYGVATVHRASNTDDEKTFERILEGLRSAHLPIVFPVHPRTRPLLASRASLVQDSKIVLCEPLSYVDMIALQARARVVITDSGGMQKEALSLGVPCVTLREETEWPETLVDDWNVLAGTDPALIAMEAQRKKPTVQPKSNYGDGETAKHIADELLRHAHARRVLA